MINKKSMIYTRLFAIYMIMAIFMIVTFDIYFIKKELNNLKNNTLYIKEKLINDVNQEVSKMSNSANLFVQNMYNDNEFITDIMDFLSMNNIEYLQNKLSKFSESKNYFYKGIENFTQNSFRANEFLKNISFISYNRSEISTFNRRNQIQVSNIKGLDKENNNNFSNVICEPGYINYIKEVRNPITFKLEGTVSFTYSVNHIKDILEKYKNIYEVMILDTTGLIVYDSNTENKEKYYQYFSKLMNSDKNDNIEDNYYIDKRINPSSLIVLGKVSKENIDKLPISFYSSLIFVDLLLFLIVGAIMYMKLKRLNNRMENIVLAMENVKNGQLDIDIPITNERDELNYISENFNEMCAKLNEYIEKSYLAELNQKNAEMIALQNQINPHFLYNTLESIRMKAICNGDREVGKMLYTLAFLFRTQLKGKNIIRIRDEIDYCKKYLDIFKFRYEDKFEFNIHCDEKLLEKQIIKFTLQPVIENYFMHGIRLEESNNILDVNISEVSDDKEEIVIVINDNGVGIAKEKIEELNSMLSTRKAKGSSIGLLNAHERLGIAYGNQYGIKIDNKNHEGTRIIIRIPAKEV